MSAAPDLERLFNPRAVALVERLSGLITEFKGRSQPLRIELATLDAETAKSLAGLRNAEVVLDAATLKDTLKTDAASLAEVQYRKNLLGSIAAGSMGSDVPARAADPSGMTFTLLRQSRRRASSRSSISQKASR